jgi:hypothetical protein
MVVLTDWAGLDEDLVSEKLWRLDFTGVER